MFVVIKQYYHYSEESHWRDNGWITLSCKVFETRETCDNYLNSLKLFDCFYEDAKKMTGQYSFDKYYERDEEEDDSFYNTYDPSSGIYKYTVSPRDLERFIIKKVEFGKEIGLTMNNDSEDYELNYVYVAIKVELNELLSSENFWIRKGKEETDIYYYWAKSGHDKDYKIMIKEQRDQEQRDQEQREQEQRDQEQRDQEQRDQEQRDQKIEVSLFEVACWLEETTENSELAWDILNCDNTVAERTKFIYFYKGKTYKEVVQCFKEVNRQDFLDIIE